MNFRRFIAVWYGFFCKKNRLRKRELIEGERRIIIMYDISSMSFVRQCFDFVWVEHDLLQAEILSYTHILLNNLYIFFSSSWKTYLFLFDIYDIKEFEIIWKIKNVQKNSPFISIHLLKNNFILNKINRNHYWLNWNKESHWRWRKKIFEKNIIILYIYR